jgi:hypothetical protein
LTILKQSSALLILFLATTLLFVESAATSPARTERDAKRVRTGKFTYRDLDHGKEVGRGTITIRGLAGSQGYAFAADFRFATEFEGFRASVGRPSPHHILSRFQLSSLSCAALKSFLSLNWPTVLVVCRDMLWIARLAPLEQNKWSTPLCLRIPWTSELTGPRS